MHPLRNTRRPLVLACVMLAMFMMAIVTVLLTFVIPHPRHDPEPQVLSR